VVKEIVAVAGLAGLAVVVAVLTPQEEQMAALEKLGLQMVLFMLAVAAGQKVAAQVLADLA
jgi:hypothetical protein